MKRSAEERGARRPLILAFAVFALAGVLGSDVVELVQEPLRIGVRVPCWIPLPPWALDFALRVAFAIMAVRTVDRRGTVRQWRAAFWHIGRGHVVAGWTTAHALGEVVQVFEGAHCG